MSIYIPSQHHGLQVTNIDNIVMSYVLKKKFGCSTVWALHDCNELVLIRKCSSVHLMQAQEVQKGGSSLFQSWTPYKEMLFIFHLPCVA